MKTFSRHRKAEYWMAPSARPIAAIPELLYAGRYKARNATPMIAHRHACLEVCYIEKGIAEWWVGRKSYAIAGGQFFLIRPHELHGGIDKIHQPCSYSYVGLRVSSVRLLHLPAGESRSLLKAINGLPERCFPAPDPAQTARLFAMVLSAIGSSDALATIHARMNLTQILLGLVAAGRAAKAHGHSNVVSEAIKLMEANIEHPLRLDSLAQRLGWSISHLKSRFRTEMGVAPADYYLRLRLKRACEELRRTDAEITAIALRLGFSSSQYFATAFKHVIGASPRDYRRRVR